MFKATILSAIFCAFAAQGTHAQPYVGWSMGYYTDWSSQPPSAINWKAYTHVAYFSLMPNNSGVLHGPSAATAKAFVAQCHSNGVKAIICVGGDGTDGAFAAATGNDATRAVLVQQIVSYVSDNGFDGADMDWESKSESAGRVAIFKQFHQEIRAGLDKLTPRRMLTAAVADWYPKCSASIAPFCDQLNCMSYYNLVGGQDTFMRTLTSQGVAKSKLGVGYGFDNSDGEKDINNPTDIGAKIHYTINNGYGGIMVWEIMKACPKCDDSAVQYVSHDFSATGTRAFAGSRNGATLSISGLAGAPEIRYSLITEVGNSQTVDLGLYDLGGSLLKTLAHGPAAAGAYVVPLNQGSAIKSGAYVVKLATPSGIRSAKLILP